MKNAERKEMNEKAMSEKAEGKIRQARMNVLCEDPASPVTFNPKEDAFYEKVEAELNKQQNERIAKIEEAEKVKRLNENS